jgi:hypothetical protein
MKEIWKDILGYEGKYQVSNAGKIKNVVRGTIKAGQIQKDGYEKLVLYKDNFYKSYYVHRLVLTTFIGNGKDKDQANHLDGNKANNYLENLEWCTRGENMKHADKLGLRKMPKGKDHYKALLTEKEVLMIREKYHNRGSTLSKLAREYKANVGSVYNIVKGISWKHLPMPNTIKE